MLSQDSFDFHRFDAIAAYFDPVVDTTKKFDVSIRSITGPIASAIQSFAGLAERLGTNLSAVSAESFK